jgi:hypothetical protein
LKEIEAFYYDISKTLNNQKVSIVIFRNKLDIEEKLQVLQREA